MLLWGDMMTRGDAELLWGSELRRDAKPRPLLDRPVPSSCINPEQSAGNLIWTTCYS